MEPRYQSPGGVIDVGESFSNVENPFLTSEKSLVLKRDKALEKAAKKASLTWKDKRELRKATSRKLLDLTQQTSDDLKEAIVTKFRSDLNFFVTAHQMRNMANLERLKISFENALTEAYAESSRDRMDAKMKVLLSATEKMTRRVEEAKRHAMNGNGKYSTMVLESFERLFQNTINEIESISVRMNQPYFMRD